MKAKKNKALRDAIYDPAAIIASNTSQDSGVVMVLDVESVNGKKAIAAVEIDGVGWINRKAVDGHYVTSTHGRANTICML
ncbi:MAG: hypothetical protein II117_08375 [Clostridia bacterium]|nr:hypothetical protein [Clostridia bacterium]